MSLTVLSKMSPKLNMHGEEWAEYKARTRSKYIKSNEALYEETKEWCTNYACGHSWVVAWILKLFDTVLNLALTVIYATLDALMGVLLTAVGPVAKITDEVAIFLCYMFSFSSDPCWCCDKSAILDAFWGFIQNLYDGAYEIVKKIAEVIWMVIGLWNRLTYSCECERIAAELQETYKNELDSARAQYRDKYDKYVAVTTIPSPRDEKTYYLVVSSSRPTPSILFKKHVEATVAMYNKWPYSATDDCPAALATRVISGITWKTYAYILCSNWLSTTNINKDGFTKAESDMMLEYCKAKMPTDLYNFVLFQIDSAMRPPCEIAENENWAGRA